MAVVSVSGFNGATALEHFILRLQTHMDFAMAAGRLVIVVTFVLLSVSLPAGSDAQAQRIYFAYEKPHNPAHQSLYEFVKERHVLERLQELFGPFRLPSDLTFKMVGCDGRSNAWYEGSSV